MKKKIYIGAAVVVVVGLVIGSYLVLQSRSSIKENPDQQTLADESGQNVQVATIRSLLVAGQDKQCELENEESAGTINFSAQNQLRATLTDKSNSILSVNVIISGGQQYIWGINSSEGVRSTVSLEEDTDSTDDTVASRATEATLSKEYTFRCSDWQLDPALFTPPTQVDFRELTLA